MNNQHQVLNISGKHEDTFKKSCINKDFNVSSESIIYSEANSPVLLQNQKDFGNFTNYANSSIYSATNYNNYKTPTIDYHKNERTSNCISISDYIYEENQQQFDNGLVDLLAKIECEINLINGKGSYEHQNEILINGSEKNKLNFEVNSEKYYRLF